MRENILAITISIFLLVFISAIVSAEFSVASISTADTDCNAKDNYNAGDAIYIKVNNFSTGSHEWRIIGQENSCNPDATITSGSLFINSNPSSFCFDVYNITSGDCGEYKVIVSDLFFGEQNTAYHVNDAPVYVPEFGLIIGTITILSALATFMIIRKN